MTAPSDLQSSLDFDHAHIWHPYAAIPAERPPYLVENAKGSEINIAGIGPVIDGMSSWWSVIHGYNHPQLNQAIKDQVDQMSHVMFGGLTHRPAIALAEKLVNLTPEGLDHVFFADSGSVAVEVALKMALQYWKSQSKPSKHRMLSFKNAYHGDTFAAMSVCDPVNGMHHLFSDVLMQNLFLEPPPAGIDTAITPQLEIYLRDVFQKQADNLAAVIIEPIVQGTGGMRIYSRHFLHLLRQLCDEFDVLLIADEIATGFGRTGKLFACQHADVVPDILCLGKAITGGYLSFATTLCNTRVAEGISQGEAKVLMHGPTFMGNPLACAAANASIHLLQQYDWEKQTQAIEQHFTSQFEPLTQLEWVNSTRSLGAIGAIELTRPCNLTKVTQQLLEQGVWLRPFGKLIYSMPPYTISPDELAKLTDAIVQVIKRGDLF